MTAASASLASLAEAAASEANGSVVVVVVVVVAVVVTSAGAGCDGRLKAPAAGADRASFRMEREDVSTCYESEPAQWPGGGRWPFSQYR